MKKNDAHVREYQRYLCHKSVRTFSFKDYLEILFFIISILIVGYLIGYSHALYDLFMLLDFLNQKF